MRAGSFAVLLVVLLALVGQVAAESTPTYTGPQYITSAIVWGLLVALMLLFVLYIGISCIMSIERPVRMTTVPLQMGKEY